MKKPQITITQKRFLEKFDDYTNRGSAPQKIKDLRSSWKIQDRTINKCYRLGLLRKVDTIDDQHRFVVNPDYREVLGFVRQSFQSHVTRKRSSAI